MYCISYNSVTELQIQILNNIIDIKNIITYPDYISYEFRWVRVVIIRKDLKLTRRTHYILGEKYSLLDIKTINKFKFDITPNYINFICANGKVDILVYILERWLKSGKKPNLELKYNEDALNVASEYGHVNVLDWWLKASKESGLELKYNGWALCRASRNGHVNILDWWLKSGLELNYSEYALNWASMNGRVNVLEWWLKSGLVLKYDKESLHSASANGSVNVLDWWLNANKESGLELKYKINFNYMLENVREWWLKSGLDLKN